MDVQVCDQSKPQAGLSQYVCCYVAKMKDFIGSDPETLNLTAYQMKRRLVCVQIRNAIHQIGHYNSKFVSSNTYYDINSRIPINSYFASLHVGIPEMTMVMADMKPYFTNAMTKSFNVPCREFMKENKTLEKYINRSCTAECGCDEYTLLQFLRTHRTENLDQPRRYKIDKVILVGANYGYFS